MKWEEYSQYKYKIDWEAREKYREPEWKESSLGPKRRIPDKKDRKKNIDPKTDDRTKCGLEYTMQRYEIIKDHTR